MGLTGGVSWYVEWGRQGIPPLPNRAPLEIHLCNLSIAVPARGSREPSL